jgi:hypothetical protein
MGPEGKMCNYTKKLHFPVITKKICKPWMKLKFFFPRMPKNVNNFTLLYTHSI